MSDDRVLIAGVLALDDLKTPEREGKNLVGGAGIYSSLSSCIFTNTSLVGAVGTDFPFEVLERMKERGIDMENVKIIDTSSFHWSGEYIGNMEEAITHHTETEILEKFDWKIKNENRNPKALLLCNSEPKTQLRVLQQVNTEITAADTMNLWIKTTKKELDKVVSQVRIMYINEMESLEYTKEKEYKLAAKRILEMGPEYVVIKRGANGSDIFSNDEYGHIPAVKIEQFVDPTGAGDSFAGASISWLAEQKEINFSSVKKSLEYGTAVASFTVEGMGPEKMWKMNKKDIEKRVDMIK